MPNKEEIQKYLAASLRKHRKDLALTQVKFAAEAGIDYRHYQELEAGRVDPKISTIWKISSAFDLQISALLPSK